MMKRLILVRHAKSSWDNPDQDDFDRTLNGRGKKDGPVMAAEMKQRIASPDLILSSDSVRTTETVAFILDAYGMKESQVAFRRELYCAEDLTLLEVISRVEDATQSVMLMSHNPGLTMLHNRLMWESPVDNLPTFGVAELELPIQSWREIKDVRNARRTTLLFPKMLAAESR